MALNDWKSLFHQDLIGIHFFGLKTIWYNIYNIWNINSFWILFVATAINPPFEKCGPTLAITDLS